jgi:hypothetical protein
MIMIGANSATGEKVLDLLVHQGSTGSTLLPFIPESFTVVTKENESPYAGGVVVSGKFFSTHLYLKDASGNTFAYICKEGKDYHVLSTKPFMEGQETSRIKDAGTTLYCWYIIETGAVGVGTSYIKVWTKKGYVSLYHCEAHSTEELVAKGIPAPVSIKKHDDGSVVTLMKQIKRANILGGHSWEVIIAAGMDPCLVICFVSIVDIVMEKMLL